MECAAGKNEIFRCDRHSRQNCTFDAGGTVYSVQGRDRKAGDRANAPEYYTV